eukprot:TRINITY_DN44741_c0_g1_i3.p1 TRINITY_DN44741_c0_g1~~TRINITY_DN44741_c0_g1_i3.p1  ORF type:complete len:289 (-),score=35.35 TRINITY_DN44741_c0_g1_i3:165-1031(-)
MKPQISLPIQLVLGVGAAGEGNPACWSGRWSWNHCCHERFGQRGNEECWDGSFTYTTCCLPSWPSTQDKSAGAAKRVSLEMGELRGMHLELFESPGILQRWKPDCVLQGLKAMIEGLWKHNSFQDKVLYIVSDVVRLHSEGSTDKEMLPVRSVASLQSMRPDDIPGNIFMPFFDSDDDLAIASSAIVSGRGKLRPPLFDLLRDCWVQYDIGRSRFLWTDTGARQAVAAGIRASDIRGWGYVEAHEALCQALAVTRPIEGSFVEVGVFRGQSAMTALRYMNASKIRRQV